MAVNNRQIKKVEGRIKELKLLQGLNAEQMNADLTVLADLELALKNVAKIYQDVMDVLMPIMEKLLNELSDKYGNNFSNMPSEKVETIRNIKDILKDLSEVTIIPRKAVEPLVADVIDYSNDLTVKHYELKAEMQKIA